MDVVEQRPVIRDEAPIGCVGELILPTRGARGPGEVLVRVRGGTEAYIAWSEEPLARGTSVLVIDFRGARTVDVMEWSGTPDEGMPT
jgi:membrane protein implicated in regulation of membrane protease activity